jgi:hypothetical protein
MRDHNEFGRRGKRFRSEEGLKKSRNHRDDSFRKRQREDITSQIYALPEAYVNEAEEESILSSDDERCRKKKVKIMTLG